MDESFCPEDVRVAIKKVSPQSTPGSSVLRFSHRQIMPSDELTEDMAGFVRLVFSNSCLPDLFWVLYTATNLRFLSKMHDQSLA